MTKRLLPLLLGLTLLLGCFAGCASDSQPTGGDKPSASGTTTTATDTSGNPIVPTDPSKGDTLPTDQTGETTVPTDENGKTVATTPTTGKVTGGNTATSSTMPPTIATGAPKSGYAAVGYVNTTTKQAIVLLGNGTSGTVTYTGTAPKKGAVHQYVRDSKDKYTFTYPKGNTHLKTSSDQLTGSGCPIFASPEGYMWSFPTAADKLMHYHLENTPIFIRYSAVEWRLASASDIKNASDTAYMDGYFFSAAKASDYEEKDGFRWYKVGAVLLGNADSRGGLYAPNLFHFDNVDPNVTLGTVSSSSVQVITTKYQTSDVVIADTIATDKMHGADPTGTKDSTAAIQNALNAVAEMGGGTVWLPAGKYRITGNITIPAFVTLRGDWQDPDKGTDYGTILLLDVPSKEAATGGTFKLGGSSGLMGLTFYYPNQSLSSVKPYPFTVYVDGEGTSYMLQTIQNCTFINAYKAIGASVSSSGRPHEMLTIENVRGTVLSVGVEEYNEADVGTWKNLTLSPKYWSEAPSWMNPPNRTTLANYTRQHTIGLKFGDLEWAQLGNVTLSDFAFGIRTVKGHRSAFSAAMYNVSVTNCDVAFRVDDAFKTFGSVITNSTFSGNKSLVNNVSGTELRFAGVTFTGTKTGTFKQTNVTASDMKTLPEWNIAKPAAKLTVVTADKTGKKDISSALQNAINARSKDGGGVVYLPAGTYRLEKPITVPAGVELRGCASVATRDQYNSSKGTLILVYTDKQVSDAAASTATAMITLTGNNAGVRGLRFMYPDTINLLSKGNTGIPYNAYTIRGKAKNLYVINSAIVGAYNGIDFRGCDGHYIKKVVTGAMANGMFVGGNGGVVESCLQNGNTLCRMGLSYSVVTPVAEADVWTKVFDPIMFHNLTYIRVDAGAKQVIHNAFAYGAKTLISSKATDLWVVNAGADYLNKNITGTRPMAIVEGGSSTFINLMRSGGSSYQKTAGSIKIINRVAYRETTESQKI